MSESICQSCGMDMKSAEEFGTNADLSQKRRILHLLF